MTYYGVLPAFKEAGDEQVDCHSLVHVATLQLHLKQIVGLLDSLRVWLHDHEMYAQIMDIDRCEDGEDHHILVRLLFILVLSLYPYTFV